MNFVRRTSRSAISPFLATVVLVVITLMIGGILYTQFRQMIVSQMKNPSLALVGLNVGPDGETMTMNIKNDGNVPVSVTSLSVAYGASTNSFQMGSNVTQIASSSPGSGLDPGETLTLRVKSTFVIPSFASFTLTVIGDKIAKSFNVQA